MKWLFCLIAITLSVPFAFADEIKPDRGPFYTLPEWRGLDTIDRKYPGPVECSFEASTFRNVVVTTGRGLRASSYLEAENLFPSPADRISASMPTLGESLVSACTNCLDSLRKKRKALARHGIHEFMESCLLDNCHTVNSRRIPVAPRILEIAKKRMKDPLVHACSQYTPVQTTIPPVSYSRYFKVYSRPNDDSFQNAAGEEGNGEPYEVAIMYGALVVKHTVGKPTVDLRFDWKAELTTGRQVEAGKFICMHEFSTNIPGQKPHSVIGEEDKEKKVDLKIRYPRGVTEESGFEEKPGSVLSASLPLGRVSHGKYSGRLYVRGSRSGRGRPAMGDLPAIPKSPSHVGGIIKIMDWSITLDRGTVTDVSLNIKRQHNDPPLRLVDSNMVSIDRSLPAHHHYYQQERRAICASETVGDGDLPNTEGGADKLTREAGKMIVKAGCLLCHGEGAADLFRFCDSGISIRPAEDAAKIYSMIVHGVPQDRGGREPYPEEMFEAMDALKALEKEQQIIKKWAEMEKH